MGAATIRPIEADTSTHAQVPALRETVLQGPTWANLRAVAE
jgi:hypothetical protein